MDVPMESFDLDETAFPDEDVSCHRENSDLSFCSASKVIHWFTYPYTISKVASRCLG